MKDIIYIKKADRLEEAIAEIFHFFDLGDLRNKKVFVKPNMLRPAKPEEGIVTNPDLISATVSFLLRAGADVIVGDNHMPGTKHSGEIEVAEHCGFVDASHGSFRNIGRYSKKIVRQKNLLKEVYVSREVLDCDILVSLPKFKTHELTMMTVAVKNHFGIVPGGLKPLIHALFPKISDFSKVLVDTYQIRPPDLIIVDCLNIIDAKGKRFEPGKLIAGNNGHAVDYICALMAGVNPYQVPTVKVAWDEKLFDPERIEYFGAVEELSGYALPFSFPFRNTIIEFFAQIFYRILLKRVPIIDVAQCVRCLSCENVCPKKAIKNQNIDYKKCINCYCCLEVCPNQAIKTKFKI